MPSSIVPCVTWVPKGKAKQHPTKITLSPEELRALWEKADSELKENEEELRQIVKEELDGPESDEEDDPELAKFDLDNYDDDEVDGEEKGVLLAGLEGAFTDMLIQSGADEYITLEKEKGSDDEDDEIKAEDSLLVVGKVADDLSTLEIMVYNENEGSEYVHHDQLLDIFPLCLEWMDFPVHIDNPQEQQSTRANIIVAGSMMPCLNFWNLDVVDTMEPALQLGSTKRSKKKKNAGIGHNDAVLSLAWNPIARHLLASASADCTVIVWDLRSRTCAQTLKAHNDKVQTLAWHPFEATSLLSGGMDKSVRLYDCRDPEKTTRAWPVSGEVENVLWNRFEPYQFLASCDDGFIYCMDVRQAGNKPLYQLSAHSKAVNAISMSPTVEGVLASVSSDRELKVWDIQGGKPSCVLSRNMKMGELLSTAFCHDAPFTLAIGGEKQGVRILNLLENATIRNHFAGRQPKTLQWVTSAEENSEAATAASAAAAMDTGDAATASASSSPIAAAAANSSSEGKASKKKKSKTGKNKRTKHRK
ncbi:periodic tryptophan protein 1 homolog [Sycon ciliatum]|uniref:periodic tryptophan protein 1 homolog n=1 Tax=Sycon ciliatum TaxID=27933 RepID=UPI0020AD6E7C|eukprot:scpid61041/ scgid28072/ Periodic tryptophan protein 1 homolog